MRWGLAAGIVIQVLGVLWDGGLAQAGELAIGMSQRQVVMVLGPPIGTHIERNAVVCLTYEAGSWGRWAHVFGERIRVIAFQEGRLVDDTIVRPVGIRFHCSHVAGRWDPPMRVHDLCPARPGGRC
jgi:hypothetical protein